MVQIDYMLHINLRFQCNLLSEAQQHRAWQIMVCLGNLEPQPCLTRFCLEGLEVLDVKPIKVWWANASATCLVKAKGGHCHNQSKSNWHFCLGFSFLLTFNPLCEWLRSKSWSCSSPHQVVEVTIWAGPHLRACRLFGFGEMLSVWVLTIKRPSSGIMFTGLVMCILWQG
jgi:hypothetical protein